MVIKEEVVESETEREKEEKSLDEEENEGTKVGDVESFIHELQQVFQ
jgi:hypothetical protein